MSTTTEYVQIKDLKPGMKNINAVFIVLEVGPVSLTKEAREVRTLRVGDASACVNLSVWDAPGALLQPGDIVRLSRGYASLWRNVLTLYSGKAGDLQKVGEFCMLFNEQVNMSEPQPNLPIVGSPAANGAHPGHAGALAGGHVGTMSGAGGPPRAAPSPSPSPAPPAAAPPKQERYSSDNKHQHKTYVRGRAHQRSNTRR